MYFSVYVSKFEHKIFFIIEDVLTTVSGQKFLYPPPRFPIRIHVKLLFKECL